MKKRNKLIPLLLMTMVLLATVGCTGPKKDKKRSTEIGSISGFRTVDLNGEEVTSDVLKNKKRTLVTVMSSTCNSCMKELPDLAELSKELKKQNVGFLGLNTDINPDGTPDQNSAQAIKKVLKDSAGEMKIVFPDEVLLDKVLTKIDALPYTFFVDQKGKIMDGEYLGSRSKEEWAKIIKAELEKH